MAGGVKVAWLATILTLAGVAVGLHNEDNDVACLREFKESVTDPLGYLQNWDFRGRNADFCSFVGVTCVPGGVPKVSSIDLAAAGLGGRFPRGLAKCSSLAGLDLSNNFLKGRIPPRICVDNPMLTRLDLSGNSFSGRAPEDVRNNCLRFRQTPSQSLSTGSGVDSDAFIRMSPKPTESG